MGKRYYDNYDYEEAYKEQCKKLEEAEMERWMKEEIQIAKDRRKDFIERVMKDENI